MPSSVTSLESTETDTDGKATPQNKCTWPTHTSRPPNGELSIAFLQLKKAAFILRALNHCLRLDLLRHLHRRSECCVSEWYHAFTLEQSVASQHLAILRRAGIVSTRRAGKQIFYSINYPRLVEFQSLESSLLP